MTTKQEQLQQMLRKQQIRELSSDEEDQREQILQSRSQYRKPIKDPFSGESNDSDSDGNANNNKSHMSPFPPKQPKPKNILLQAQQSMKWTYTQDIQNQILLKLQGQGMKDKKIRQLASKLKSLNLAYEKQKTLRRNFQNQLNSIIKTNQEMRTSSIEKKQKKSLDKTLKSQTKCSNCQQNDKKIMDMRLKNQNLKTQLNKAMRVISRQIGQNFNIDQVLSQQNAWKGRQQKIQKLKSRVRELEDKLQNNGINVSHMSGFTQVSQVTKTNANFSVTANRTSALLAQSKRKQLQNLKVQVDALKSENQLLQGKVKSLTSRKIIVQNQIKELKNDFETKKQIFIQKSENDDKFIQLLKSQNEKLKKNQKVITKVIYKEGGEQTDTLKKEIQILRKRLAEAQQQNKSKQNIPSQKEIKSLNAVKREVSADKRKEIQDQYIKNNKYLKELSQEQQQQLYRNWKQNKL